MSIPSNINAIDERIRSMKASAQELKDMGKEMPAVYRNAVRILASLKMLEINICDVIEAGGSPKA